MSLADAFTYASAAWKLDEASGTRFDQVGSNDLTDNNTVGQGTGKVNTNCADFEAGNSEYLTLADTSAVDLSSDSWTIRFWFQIENDQVNPAIVGKGNRASSLHDYYVGYFSIPDVIEQITFYVNRPTLGSRTIRHNVLPSGTGTRITEGTWYLVHAWYDDTGNEFGVCLNNDTPTMTSSTENVRNTTDPFIIADELSQSVYHDGLVDDVVILKGYVMTADDRTADWNSGEGIAFADWGSGGGAVALQSSLRSPVFQSPTIR